jgi:triacylglycerol esterase/lipase EstA (alpha/beta hydrolase family)
VGTLIACCALYVLFSYATAFAGRSAPPDAKLWRAAWVELLIAIAIVPFWPLWWLLGAVYRAAEEGVGTARGRRNPIVLLHGFGMNRTQWMWMARRLRERGHGPIYGANYFSLQGVPRSARRLQRFVDQVLAAEQVTEVDIVAHSLGGIVARYFIERLSGSKKVGRLITIGTPHAGTRLGRFAPLIPSARDLLGDSVILVDLGLVRPGTEYTSIWSKADAIIQPPESSSILPAGVDAVFDDLGHLSLVFSSRVVDVIDARLRV